MFYMENLDGCQIPKFSEMFVPILSALTNLGGSASLEELDQESIRIMEIPKPDTKVLHNGGRKRTEVRYRLAWARTYLKKYGLIDNPERGTWCLADTFDGNFQNINSDAIVRFVQTQNLIEFKNAAVSELEASTAFDYFALSALQSYARTRDEAVFMGYRLQRVQFDAMLPNGISENRRKTYVEIRTAWNISIREYLACIANVLTSDECFLLIFGDQLSAGEKRKRLKEIQAILPCDVMVWDYDDFLKYIVNKTDDISYLSSPRKTLAEGALLRTPDSNEQREIKRLRLEQLKQAYEAENVTLCLGAGVSHDAGIPLWNELIHELLVLMINYKTQGEFLNQGELTRITQLATSNQEDSPLTQVRYIRAAFEADEREDYYELVRKVLYKKKIQMSSPLLDAISKLCKPERNHIGVKGVITYNFDDLLERKLQTKGIKYNVVYREEDLTDISSLNIYHVHGFLPHNKRKSNPADTALIFSEEDYHEVYRDAYCWSNITQLNAFRENVCLFIGCSLTDPNIRRLLDISARSCAAPRHFAIMKRKTVSLPASTGLKDKNTLKMYQKIDDNIREAYFRTLGIEVIWVNRFNEIPAILTGLLKNAVD